MEINFNEKFEIQLFGIFVIQDRLCPYLLQNTHTQCETFSIDFLAEDQNNRQCKTEFNFYLGLSNFGLESIHWLSSKA